MSGPRAARFVAASMAVLALSACAGSVTAPSVTTPLAVSASQPLHVTAVTIDTANGVFADEATMEDIHQRIVALLPDVVAGAPDCTMHVQLTRFDKGSAAGRALFIGLGQIHIEGIVTLTDATGRSLGEYKIRKTFAAGGLAGAMTTVGDVEAGFAKSVIAPILDRK